MYSSVDLTVEDEGIKVKEVKVWEIESNVTQFKSGVHFMGFPTIEVQCGPVTGGQLVHSGFIKFLSSN